MSTTTEFLGEIAHRYDTDRLAVLFSEESHRTGLLCLINRHNIGCYRNRLVDLLIDHILNLFKFFRCHCCKMRKVKSCTLAVLIRTGLLNMCS